MVRKGEPVALEIKVDFLSGERAGGISPTDRNLVCLSLWQDLDAGVEMRLVTDDRDLSQYEGIDGVEVHRGVTRINERVQQLFKPRVEVFDKDLFAASIKTIDLSDLNPDLSPEDQLKKCKEKGALGIRIRGPQLLTA